MVKSGKRRYFALESSNGRFSGHNSYNYTVTLHLRHLSTGTPHALAQQPSIPIVRSSVRLRDECIFEKIVATMQIVGKNILVLLRWSVGLSSVPAAYDRLILVDWMTGCVLAVRYNLA